jgi:alanine-glyoxylate transaminase/serine-glyoxylate transaminase/serine-pyruvate transaminase
MKIEVEFVPGDWRRGVNPDDIEARLLKDKDHSFKAVMVVHSETSTGVVSRIHEVRRPSTAPSIRRC